MESGRRTLLFGEVNDRMYELLNSTDPDLPVEFLCECGTDCGHRVQLLPAAFAALRDSGRTVRSSDCRPRGVLRRRSGRPVAGSVPALG